MAAKIDIRLDGSSIAKLGVKQTCSVDLPAGKYVVTFASLLKADLVRPIIVPAGETISLDVGFDLGGDWVVRHSEPTSSAANGPSHVSQHSPRTTTGSLPAQTASDQSLSPILAGIVVVCLLVFYVWWLYNGESVMNRQGEPTSSTSTATGCKSSGEVTAQVESNLRGNQFDVRNVSATSMGDCSFRVTYTFRLNAAARDRLAFSDAPVEASAVAEQWREGSVVVDASK